MVLSTFTIKEPFDYLLGFFLSALSSSIGASGVSRPAYMLNGKKGPGIRLMNQYTR